jgi:hypothetical protein
MTDNPIDSMPGISVGDGPDPKRWSILLVVVIAQLMVVLDASIVTIALPSAGCCFLAVELPTSQAGEGFSSLD